MRREMLDQGGELLDAVPDGPQVKLELTIPDVPDFYSALTNHTGCRRPLAHPPVGRTGVCYFLTPVTRPLVGVASPRAAAESA